MPDTTVFKSIIGLLLFLFFVATGLFLFYPQSVDIETDPQLKQAKSRAETWIREHSPTYTFDGFDLELEETEKLKPGSEYRFIFSFKSRAAGYGDRTGKMLAQVITPHEIEVTVKNNQVTSAAVDDGFDELKAARKAEKTQTVTITLYETVDGQEQSVEVKRILSDRHNPPKQALELLLKGPSAAEKEAGLYSTIDEATRLQSFKINNKTATVDFSPHLEPPGGSAWVTAVQTQITQTLTQFKTIENVTITINNQPKDILQP